MKRTILTLLGVGFIFASCSKDFLETSPTQTISKSDIDKISEYSPHLGIATLNGLYAYNVKAESGGTTGHDDFGQKGYDVYSDMLSGDMVLNNEIYGWYSGIADLTDMINPSNLTNYRPWRFYYYMVRGANNVIESFKDNTTPEGQVVLAEAKALRAYVYYNLVMLYTAGYDANEKILPVYETPSQENMPAKLTQDVFELMISDLSSSLSLFEDNNATGKGNIAKGKIDYNVAKGILCYVYAAKGTSDALSEAAKLSKEIVDSGVYTVANEAILLGGFNKAVSNPNWMWGATLTTENDLDLISWWGQIDVFTYSYASVGDSKGMNKELYEAIKPDDVRKKQFEVSFSPNNFGSNTYLPVNKFYSATGKVLQGQRIIESDYIYMRIEEMYLLNAEANARLGQEAEAKQTLKNLLSSRIDDVSYIDALSGDALLSEILLQTRIELWGEGKSYAAVKRNKKDFVYGSNHLHYANSTFSYDDRRLKLSVPQNEILNNPVYNN
ncbi:RagB/SusD family nutrient uptake outer membrane protein [Myroides injenensis]|uniref:RagB/SusD family nutrient uptake outer membrane protein n=1 Tax=Myroides injenensis TaxID=1183151 RepID=UPI000287E6FF|nr:RagB/SusD family nutrient uptake outer membrane protein [Myroides injenensis]